MPSLNDRHGQTRLPWVRQPVDGSVRAYALAVMVVAAAVAIRLALQSWFGEDVPFLLFFPAILIAAWYGGLGPGTCATVLSALAAMYFFMPPSGFAVGDGTGRLFLAIFVAIGLAIAGLNHELQTAAVLASSRAEQLDTIINTTVDGIIVIDTEGRIEAFNRGAERLFGYPQSEVLGRNVSMLMPSPYHEEHDGYLKAYRDTGQGRIIGIGREVSGRRRDGTVFPLHLSVGEMLLGGQRKFTGMLHDLTKRARLEEQLREQAALARLGEMAAVIAHEVKNPLAGIRGAIQIFAGRMPQGSQEIQVVTEIVSRIDALDQMMKDLLLFARPPNPRRAVTDVVPLVRTTVSLLSQDPAFEDVDVEIEGQAPPVSADADMLRIVFQNLLINGAHAMKGKGKIRVAIEGRDSACEVSFVDAGPGIPLEIREKIFTPFFTTKSRGSGLGLPTAKRIIEAHQGQLTIDCPPAGGTTVVIRLPTGAT
jgi:two-component system sensor kinase FixL